MTIAITIVALMVLLPFSGDIIDRIKIKKWGH